MKKSPIKQGQPPLSTSQRKSHKRNSSSDFPVRHLTQTEYLKLRNINMMENDEPVSRDVPDKTVNLTVNPMKDNKKSQKN